MSSVAAGCENGSLGLLAAPLVECLVADDAGCTGLDR